VTNQLQLVIVVVVVVVVVVIIIIIIIIINGNYKNGALKIYKLLPLAMDNFEILVCYFLFNIYST
jgi:hypothetical protein